MEQQGMPVYSKIKMQQWKFVMRVGFLLSFIILFYGCKSEKHYTHPHVQIETTLGYIEVELYPEKAPKTVAAFLSYVDSGYYKRANFYRVLNDLNQPINAPKTELVQGGIWKTNNQLATSVPGIPHESTQQTGLKHEAGTVSLARMAPGTAGTEFFICMEQEPGLDYGGANMDDKQGFAVFGKVVKGMDIVEKIYNSSDYNQYLDPPVVIFNIRRL
ncbi:peptidylprolyl isomerase [Hydrotalea sp.]|uniref:peptidylprolyl isomerase n=1 Tax=Hydrotalea sp. TaxID=2881279 RepID=UPI0026150296|nr:peptidylprolyl isomerase [Hydrotalea sp.]